jgi:hypothetical protein
MVDWLGWGAIGVLGFLILAFLGSVVGIQMPSFNPMILVGIGAVLIMVTGLIWVQKASK